MQMYASMCNFTVESLFFAAYYSWQESMCLVRYYDLLPKKTCQYVTALPPWPCLLIQSGPIPLAYVLCMNAVADLPTPKEKARTLCRPYARPFPPIVTYVMMVIRRVVTAVNVKEEENHARRRRRNLSYSPENPLQELATLVGRTTNAWHARKQPRLR